MELAIDITYLLGGGGVYCLMEKTDDKQLKVFPYNVISGSAK